MSSRCRARAGDVRRSPWPRTARGWGLAVVSSLAMAAGGTTVSAQGESTFECLDPGDRRVTRVVGGQTASPDMAPWMLSLQRRDPLGWYHTCGASLIGPSWALTAAHCVDDASPVDLRVMHGSKRLSSGGEFRGIDRIVVHEQYVSAARGDDVALLRLNESLPVPRSQMVQLLTRQLERNFGAPGACSVVTGWGSIEAWRRGHGVRADAGSIDCERWTSPSSTRRTALRCIREQRSRKARSARVTSRAPWTRVRGTAADRSSCRGGLPVGRRSAS